MSDFLSPPIWIDSPAGLLEMKKRLLAEKRVAVDTESNGLHAYREQVCLLQFSIPESDYLVDPLVIQDLSPLAELFASTQVEKVFHAAEYDVICLKRDYGFVFEHIFDTMVAARVLGVREIGLDTLLLVEFELEVDKRLQKSNWAKRPLPKDQLDYARMDTHYLLNLRDVLEARLIENELLGLAQEDFARMTRVCGSPPTPLEEQLWHITGARDLPSHQAAILLELLKWREQTGKALNRPVFKVINTDQLLTIAFTQPGNLASLQSRAHLTDRMVEKYGLGLIAAVEAGTKKAPIRPPAPEVVDYNFRQRVERLKTMRKQAAAEMKVESDIVLPRELLFQLAQDPPADWQAFTEVMSMYPWRLKKYGKLIFQAIHSIKE